MLNFLLSLQAVGELKNRVKVEANKLIYVNFLTVKSTENFVVFFGIVCIICFCYSGNYYNFKEERSFTVFFAAHKLVVRFDAISLPKRRPRKHKYFIFNGF